MYKCTHVVQMYVHLCVYTCGDQSSLELEVIPHESCTFWGLLACLLVFVPHWNLRLSLYAHCPASPMSPPLSSGNIVGLWACTISSAFPFFFFCSFFFFFQCLSSEDWTRALILARQTFQQLSYLPSPSNAEVVLLWWISCSEDSIVILITWIRWQEFKTYTRLQFT